MEASLTLCGLPPPPPFPQAHQKRRSKVPSPLDIATPDMKRKKRAKEGGGGLLAAHKRKKKRDAEEENAFLPADVRETNATSARVLLSKRKKDREENLSDNKMKTARPERENDNRKKMEEVFPADRKKSKRHEEENDSKTKKKKKVQDVDRLLAADMQKKESGDALAAAGEHGKTKRGREEKKKRRVERGGGADILPSGVQVDKMTQREEEVTMATAPIEEKKKKTKSADVRQMNGAPAHVPLSERKKESPDREENLSGNKMKSARPEGQNGKKVEDADDCVFPDDGQKKRERRDETKRGREEKKKKKRRVEGAGGADLLAHVDETTRVREEGVTVATMEAKGTGGAAEATDDDETDHDRSYGDLLAEMEEYVPDVRTRSAADIRLLLRNDLHRFRLFKRQGLSIRWGRFTREENRRLRANVAHLLAVTGIASREQLLFPQRFEELEAGIRKLKRQHRFMEAIAEGIARPCKQIFIRASKLDCANHMGQFSDEELRHLVKLQKRHGNDWSSIATKMGRSKYALQKRFSHIASGRGLWTAEEEDRLKEAVKARLEVLASRDRSLTLIQLCARLPWTDISQHVRTRSWTQCRLKWFSVLKLRLADKVRRKSPEGLRTSVQLISTLYASDIEDARDVDWEAVSSRVGGVTPLCMQKLFRKLKVANVPDWSRLAYGEIIDFLQEHIKPRLEEQLRCYGNREGEEQAPPDDSYVLDDIFASGDFAEVDNARAGGRGARPWLECPSPAPS